MTKLTLTHVNLDASDPIRLARFYARLLDWRIDDEQARTVEVSNPAGGVALSCQPERRHSRPTWPADAGAQQMQMHLEVLVDDLDRAVAHALDSGAVLAEFQPQDDVRVCLDPDGHPFCLYL